MSASIGVPMVPPGDRRRRKLAKAICRDLTAIAEIGGKIVAATPDIVVVVADGH